MLKRADQPFADSKKHVIILLIAIMIALNGLLFYFQNVTEQQIKSSLFEQQKERQIEANRAISQHIGSDLRTVVASLAVLATGPLLMEGDLGSEQIKRLAEKTLQDINADPQEVGVAKIDRLFIIDNNAMVKYSIDYPSLEETVRQSPDLSNLEHIGKTQETLSPVFSKGYVASDGTLRVAATYPILDSAGEYRGLVGLSMPTSSFFRHYGNVYDIQSQYLAVLDTDSVQLVHPVQTLVGTPFFGEFTQSQTGPTETLNDVVRNTLAGGSGLAIYEFRNGERLTTGHPIFIQGVPTYFVFIITPTSAIYSQIDSILFGERVQTLVLLSGVTAAIAVLIVFLLMWNQNLNTAVRQRTEQLEESNKQLSFANERLIKVNEQLKDSKKAQEEFINIAAHELRTPIQPIIGLVEILEGRHNNFDRQDRAMLTTINRSAQRLQRLASNILDVTKIESKALNLNKKEFDINEILSDAIEEFQRQLEDRRIRLQFQPQDETIVYADKERIAQVVDNILNNAMKYAEGGEITIETRVQDLNDNGPARRQLVVSIQDTGPGVDPEIMPKLFTRFTTRSEHGTGLGLFISKSIIEAHGGKISAENNSRGAIFSFTLPLVAKK
jgi:signal transduction histidine kinase